MQDFSVFFLFLMIWLGSFLFILNLYFRLNIRQFLPRSKPPNGSGAAARVRAPGFSGPRHVEVQPEFLFEREARPLHEPKTLEPRWREVTH